MDSVCSAGRFRRNGPRSRPVGVLGKKVAGTIGRNGPECRAQIMPATFFGKAL